MSSPKYFHLVKTVSKCYLYTTKFIKIKLQNSDRLRKVIIIIQFLQPPPEMHFTRPPETHGDLGEGRGIGGRKQDGWAHQDQYRGQQLHAGHTGG